MSILSEPRFHDPIAALEHVEKLLWPNGPCRTKKAVRPVMAP
jgi:hypothetical protein